MKEIESNGIEVTVGLYRHFKGAYYFLSSIARDENDRAICVYYNVTCPENGEYVRELCNWFDEYTLTKDGDKLYIVDRIDNFTGQKRRFEKVNNLNFQLGDVETSLLVAELDRRKDSPFRELDINKLNGQVVDRCFVCANIVGDEMRNLVAFETKEEAEEYKEKHTMINRPIKIFKRIFIEED